MLNAKQKEIASDFVNEYSDLGITHVDFIDDELEIHFKNSSSNPWSIREFNVGSVMRTLIESLENKLRFAQRQTPSPKLSGGKVYHDH